MSGWRKKLDSNKKKRRKQGNKYLIKKRKSTIQRISNHKSIKNLLLYLSWLKMEIKNHFALFPFHGWCTHNLCVYIYIEKKNMKIFPCDGNVMRLSDFFFALYGIFICIRIASRKFLKKLFLNFHALFYNPWLYFTLAFLFFFF